MIDSLVSAIIFKKMPVGDIIKLLNWTNPVSLSKISLLYGANISSLLINYPTKIFATALFLILVLKSWIRLLFSSSWKFSKDASSRRTCKASFFLSLYNEKLNSYNIIGNTWYNRWFDIFDRIRVCLGPLYIHYLLSN